MREDQSYRIKNNIGERKIMKTKSLFISTVAMVVMLIVALSVGTFAWYTAQNQVTATGAQVAAVQTDHSSIGIGWSEDATASTIELAVGSVRPMIPTAKPTDITVTAGNALTFNEALLKTNAQGTKVIASVSQNSDPWREKGVDEEGQPDPDKTTLYVHNLNPLTDPPVTTYVTPSVTIDNLETSSPHLNSLIRVAMFTKEAVGEDTVYTYLGTWGSGDAYACDIEDVSGGGENSLVGSDPETIKVADNKITDGWHASGDDGEVKIELIGDGFVQVVIYAWLEGTELTTDNMEHAAADFTVTFTASLDS